MKTWFKPWWVDGQGWEYDLIRLLPQDEARRVCNRAWKRWYGELISDPRGLLAVLLVMLPLTVSLAAVWFLAAALGWGGGGRLLAELVVHLALAHPYHLVVIRLAVPRVRPYLRDELFLLVEGGLSPQIAAAWWDTLTCHPDIPVPAGRDPAVEMVGDRT
jgi:hypothetical protein